MTISVNYVGGQAHFINPSGQNARDYWTNQLNIAAATTPNIAKGEAGRVASQKAHGSANMAFAFPTTIPVKALNPVSYIK